MGATLALAVPIGMAALGGLWSERSGVVNIGLEGMMTFGTWGAAFGSYFSGNAWLGLLGGVALGALGGLLHAVATVTFGVDHIVSGVAITILAPGVTRYLSDLLFTDEQGGGATQSPPLPDFPTLSVPGVGQAAGLAGEPSLDPRLRPGRARTRRADEPLAAHADRDPARPGCRSSCCGVRRSGCGCARAGRTPSPPSRSA